MTSRPTRTLLAAVALPLALAVTGCGGADETASPAPATTTVTEQADPTTEPTDASASPQGGGGRDAQASTGGDAALRAAARTAAAEVGGTVVNVDEQAGGWEVDLLADDGTETSIALSADGARTTGEPRVDTDDADDVAENQQLLQAASVDWDAALRTARGELGDTAIDELDLSEDDGRVVWEVSTAGSGVEMTVVIDATDGSVLAIDTDD